MRVHYRIFALSLALAAVGLGAREAYAVSACTAQQICPGSGACNINSNFDIANGCVLDFGTRDVTVRGILHLLPGASVLLRAGSFIIAPGGRIDGRADTTSQNLAGSIAILTTGAVDIQAAGTTLGRVDLSGNLKGGTFDVQAGGAVRIAGKVIADALATGGLGGRINVNSGGDITTLLNSVMSARGDTGDLGEIDLTATGRILLGDALDVSGDFGGVISIVAGADISVGAINANAHGSPGDGGDITIDAGTSLTINGVVSANGASGVDSGGFGGSVDATAEFGNITVNKDITADGTAPDGDGGPISLSGLNDVVLSGSAVLSARSASNGSGGSVFIDADHDVLLASRVDVSGGFGGGDIDIAGGRHVQLNNRLDASGRNAGSLGGSATLTAGLLTQGNLTITDVVDVGAGGCSLDLGCSQAGFTDLDGCDVTIASTGRVLARSSDAGGTNAVTAHEKLNLLGELNASKSDSAGSVQGSNALNYPSRKPPTLTGPIVPPAFIQAKNTCTAPGQEALGLCLDPCPTCGNGAVEFPEQCDDGVNPPRSCDGCDTTCRREPIGCNDNNACSADSCDLTLGCHNQALADGLSCSDNNLCNGAEVCQGGSCRPGTPLNCNDSNACTLDPCDAVIGCTAHPPAPLGTPCDDANQCTLGDRCDGAGACAGPTPRDCSDSFECTNDSCVPATGCVHPNRTGSCTDDGIACTSDVCSGGLCTHPPAPNGTPCTSALFCTANTTCQGGICAGGQPRNCGDGNACTVDTCDEGAQTCVHSPAATCCGNGVIEGSEVCDDGNTSNSDTCTNTCQPARCGDGFVQTGVEQCDAGAANSNAPDASCRPDCRPQRCGDGIVDVSHGEQCDDGNAVAGDGCTPQCTAEPPATAQLIGGGGSTTSDCVVEFLYDHAALDSKGRPSNQQSCRNGDPSCDFSTGPTAGAECVFHLWACANQLDPRLPGCVPGGPFALSLLEIKKPSSADARRHPEDGFNLPQLQSGVAGLAGTPACGRRIDIRVPLKAAGKQGKKTLGFKGRTAIGKTDNDTLKLVCTP